MKILFKQKQWVVVQVIFVILGIILGIVGLVNEKMFKVPIGGLTLGLQMIIRNGSSIPIFFILLSDLVLNVEYVQGTFLTHLLCGQSRKVWMLKKSLNFYVFVLLQFLITFALLSLAAGIITGHFGLEGLRDPDTILYNVKTVELVREIGLDILRMLMFVSFGVFVSTLLPGRLVVGSIASIGVIFIMMMLTEGLGYIYKNSKFLNFVAKNVWLEDPKESWIAGILWLVIFTWLTIEQVKRVEIASRGA